MGSFKRLNVCLVLFPWVLKPPSKPTPLKFGISDIVVQMFRSILQEKNIRQKTAKTNFTRQTARVQSFLRESCAFAAASRPASRSRPSALSCRSPYVRRIRSQCARRPTPSSVRRGLPWLGCLRRSPARLCRRLRPWFLRPCRSLRCRRRAARSL